LQFVVMALVSELERRSTNKEIEAFATPNIVHFCAVLLVSAIITAPWPSFAEAAIALALCGAAGIVYVGIVFRRTRRQTGYAPVAEDWLWHIWLPLIAYVTLLAAAMASPRRAGVALFGVGMSALLLLFVGIHNAWDTATYLALSHMQAREKQASSGGVSSGSVSSGSGARRQRELRRR
jgi:hypothetical protein